jgi:tetratricopeptide (TPR) repeat protein
MSSATSDGGSGPNPTSNLEELLRRAFAAHDAGRLDEAEYCCRMLLAADKKQFDALHLLGLIEFQRGRFDEAYRSICQALEINRRAVHAHLNLGLVLQELNRNGEALAAFDRALAIEPNHALALNNRGHLLWRLGRPDEALNSLERALALYPNYSDALCNKGNAMVSLQRFEEALASYNAALAIQPNDALVLTNRANTLWALDRRDEAIRTFDQALSLAPDDLAILKDRGTALAYLHRGEEALACFDHALDLNPGDTEFTYRRGKVLGRLERFDEAISCFDQVLAVQPDHVDALVNRGHVLADLLRNAEAMACYDRVLAIKPDLPEAHWHRGCLLLGMGDYERGWKEYEWRWQVSEISDKPCEFQQPLWLGDKSIDGKTILLHAEQGLGDTIQFVRYVPLVAALGAKVVLEVQQPLKALLSPFDGACFVIARGETQPPFDLHCPLASLPLAMKTRLETIPARTPYLSASQEHLAAWNERLPTTGRLRIGLAWAGNPAFPADRTRSIGLQRLTPLLSVPGFEFISLQKQLRPGDENILREHPELTHLGEEIADFYDTAAIVSQLDLVISSDTAVVHLAGALGRPVWVLLERVPDWRWLVERNDSPWYPTAKLFRQTKPGDWQSVIGGVTEKLLGLASTTWRQPI